MNDKQRRIAITVEIENTLNDYCRTPCIHAHTNKTNPVCVTCPVGVKLRDLGRELLKATYKPKPKPKPKPKLMQEVLPIQKPFVPKSYEENLGARWTTSEVRELQRLRKEGYTNRQIASALNRSIYAINKKVRSVKLD